MSTQHSEANAETSSENKSVLNAARMRGVVSFVRRSSRLDARLERAWQEYSQDFMLRFDHGDHDLGVSADVHVDRSLLADMWGEGWNPEGRIIVEIGTGQGENIVAAAASHPEDNFIGVEVYTPGVAHTLLLAGKNGLTNLRMVQVNAPELLAACANGLLNEVWTFFPDPWPKSKHHKRRIVQDCLAVQVNCALRDGGVWRIATDIDDYALHVHEVMDGRSDFKQAGGLVVSLPTEHVSKGNADRAHELPHADFVEDVRFQGRVLTNFENKGILAGRTIHDFTYVKK